MKNHINQQFKTRSEYIKYRNERTLSVNVGDHELKRQIKRIAKADGLNLNSWMRRYVIPYVQEVLEQQESQLRLRAEQRLKRAQEDMAAARAGRL